jgi:NADPH:quinone reductase-like Zn-dependent oxidoreductase
MRAVRFEHFGEPSDVLTVAEVGPPVAPPGHLRLRLALRPINPADLLTIRGRYGSLPPLPATPGREGVGIIVGATGAAGDLKDGDRVVPLDLIGTWQEEVVVEPARVVFVPEAVSDEAAAQSFLNPLSAWAMLDELNPAPGDWLVQSAAASALGKLVIQMSVLRGVRTLNVVRRAEQSAALQRLGADAVVVWPQDGQSLTQFVKKTTGGGLAYALDAVGGELGGEMVNALSTGGTMLLHGSLAHPETMPINSGRFLTRSLTLRGFWLNEWLGRTPLDEQRHTLGTILEHMATGAIRAPEVEATYDLGSVREAVAHAERSRDGKIMLSG